MASKKFMIRRATYSSDYVFYDSNGRFEIMSFCKTEFEKQFGKLGLRTGQSGLFNIDIKRIPGKNKIIDRYDY